MIRDGLIRRDPSTRPDAGAGRTDGRPHHLSFRTVRAVHDRILDGQPTDEVAGPPRGLRSRLDGRTRSILTTAVAAAVIVNAGAVWSYWHITGAATGQANAGTVVELNLRGRSDLNVPLTPGRAGNLIVAVTNDNNFPIRITSVSPGANKVVADAEHREKGCVDTGVQVVHRSAKVRWEVARNNVAAFTVPNGLAMAASSDPACAGAVFTVPVLVSGVAGVS